jgi:hypothetical protein
MQEPAFREVLYRTLISRREIGSIIRRTANANVEVDSAQYAGAICKNCYSAHGRTEIVSDSPVEVLFTCDRCRQSAVDELSNWTYWMHYIPLRLARLAGLGFDIHLSGGDHLLMADLEATTELAQILIKSHRSFNVIISPVLLSFDGSKMGKRNHNCFALELEQLMEIASQRDEFYLQLVSKDAEGYQPLLLSN